MPRLGHCCRTCEQKFVGGFSVIFSQLLCLFPFLAQYFSKHIRQMQSIVVSWLLHWKDEVHAWSLALVKLCSCSMFEVWYGCSIIFIIFRKCISEVNRCHSLLFLASLFFSSVVNITVYPVKIAIYFETDCVLTKICPRELVAAMLTVQYYQVTELTFIVEPGYLYL